LKKGKIRLDCDTCQKSFLRNLSDLKKSRSGHKFCSRDCKDRAARIGGIAGINKAIKHGKYVDYRRNFSNEEMKCERCNYNEFVSSVHVHHIDENHFNNDPSNLILLCSNCHSALHCKLWRLSDLDEKFQTFCIIASTNFAY
jgi:hypothetical protein